MTTEVVVVSSSSKIIWKIADFSELNYEVEYYSEVFSVGSFKWKVKICPKGDGEVYNYISLFLEPVDLTEAVNVQFSFAIISEVNSINNRVRKEATFEFPGESTSSRGWKRFMCLSELHDPAKGFIVDDTCVIRVEVSCRMKEDSIGVDVNDPTESDEDNAPESQAKKRAKLKHGESGSQQGEYPSAGQPFGDGPHNCTVGFGEAMEFEDVGGVSIFKTQVPLYKQIWLKYGHIPTNHVMPTSMYAILVMVVKDLMISIMDMHQCRYVELSSELIECWENKINMAEANKFNIGWLRKRLEIVKKGLGGMQKVKNELSEPGQPLRAANSRAKAATNELKKAEAQLISAKEYLRENVNVSGLLSESDMEMYLDIGENLLLDGLF